MLSNFFVSGHFNATVSKKMLSSKKHKLKTNLYLYIKGSNMLASKSILVFKVFLTLIVSGLSFYSCLKEKVEAPKAVKELILDLKPKTLLVPANLMSTNMYGETKTFTF